MFRAKALLSLFLALHILRPERAPPSRGNAAPGANLVGHRPGSTRGGDKRNKAVKQDLFAAGKEYFPTASIKCAYRVALITAASVKLLVPSRSVGFRF